MDTFDINLSALRSTPDVIAATTSDPDGCAEFRNYYNRLPECVRSITTERSDIGRALSSRVTLDIKHLGRFCEYMIRRSFTLSDINN